jgi:hypothetical protein
MQARNRLGVFEPRFLTARMKSLRQMICFPGRRRRVHGVAVALVVALLSMSLALRYQLLASWFGSFLLWPAATLISIWAMSFQKGDKLVLWLRRFHVSRPGGIHFDRILQGACQGSASPCACRIQLSGDLWA